MYGWSKISIAKFIAFSTKSMGCFIGKILPYFTPNFSGGNTPGPPLREGAAPSRIHPQHGLRPCAGPFVVPPMFSTNRRPWPYTVKMTLLKTTSLPHRPTPNDLFDQILRKGVIFGSLVQNFSTPTF